MTSDTQESARHYWYREEADDRSPGLEVLEAMRAYGAAESAMRRRSEGVLRMSENDVSAMRYLLRAQEQGRSVGPKELAEYLGIQSSSVTALLDRLERAGHIRREASPFDRRALIVVPAVPEDELQRAILGDMRQELVDVAASLSPEDAETVIGFLRRMREAVDHIDAAGATGRPHPRAASPRTTA
ncbi:MarR family transcriptional regulator [Leifsonia shinshuensis]|uniref:MarR family winged helix-turn-helix transcriptional regulator n=1 Tax=Leifsonia shinshuensis TaxID=150026 RepID=UPI002859E0DD|nr:MarR family transcriptional regulator [Leifsonia shinshuensis]MDR6972551.1 DNA-binding MarR family transcriptional regulator [Leifsonia shinshuensis]